MKTISKAYIILYKHSTSKSGKSQADSWRSKYIGQTGIIYIIKNNKKQYFQWHPFKNSEVLFSKGIISSNDDYEIKDDLLKITTKNSIYYFQIIDSDFEIQKPPIIW